MNLCLVYALYLESHFFILFKQKTLVALQNKCLMIFHEVSWHCQRFYSGCILLFFGDKFEKYEIWDIRSPWDVSSYIFKLLNKFLYLSHFGPNWFHTDSKSWPFGMIFCSVFYRSGVGLVCVTVTLCCLANFSRDPEILLKR